ncbi:MAG: DUF4236 domain-containing protein [Bacteroidaceae bacterium]|nr:DUF4236 domain-containing protein [Bacteroidaceae bacterium]
MGVRFNKRITILPWLKANVGKSGVSLTIGPKGKTLNVGSTGISVNVSLGQGVGYSKRLITWKKLNLLSWLGIGGAAAAKAAKKGTAKGAAKKGKKGTTTELSLDDALNEVEEGQATQPEATTSGGPLNSLQEQGGCSWGCAFFGCLGMLVVLALLVLLILYLVRSGAIDLSGILPQTTNG